MKGLVRISVMGALIVAHQLLAPVSGPAQTPDPSPSPKVPSPPPKDPSPPVGPSPEAPGPIPAPPPIFVPGSLAPVTGGSPLKPPTETGDGVVIGNEETGPIAAPVVEEPDAPFAISSPNSTA